MKKATERGAAAVEFAILVPVLIMFVFGIVEFGRAYNVQVTLTSAAREGARVMAIKNDPTAAKTAAKATAAHIRPTLADGDIDFSSAACSADTQMTMTINYRLSTVTGIAGPFGMIAKGTMLCGG